MAQPTEVATLVAASEPIDRDEESSELIHDSRERVEPPATALKDITIGVYRMVDEESTQVTVANDIRISSCLLA